MSGKTMMAAEDLLSAKGAEDIAHPGGTLFDHLRRVRDRLDEWGATHDVQLAGLCHAFYGTDGFPVALLDIADRQCLVDVVGAKAEAIVYLYGSCDRATVYPQLDQAVVAFRDRFTAAQTMPDRSSLRAFVEISAANEFDVINHNLAIAAEHGPELRKLFTRARRHLSPPARDAVASMTALQAF